MGMHNPNFSRAAIVLALGLFLAISACHYQAADIPFPVNDSGFAQPTTQPLQLGIAKNLRWLSADAKAWKPEIKALDLARLPSTTFDSTAFMPFARPAEQVLVDWSKLADSTFSLDQLPSKSLNFKTDRLIPRGPVKSALLSPKGGATMSVLDVGQAQGLQGRRVPSLIQDKNGFTWIATNEGLFRYDGEFMQNILPNSISNMIIAMVEDNQGRIWFMHSQGLGMLDLKNGTVSHSELSSLSSFNWGRMHVDGRGLIWASLAPPNGAIVIDPSAMSFKHLDASNGLSASIVLGIMEDRDHAIWLSTLGGGVDIINPATKKIRYFRESNGLSSDTVSAMAIDSKNQIWLAIGGHGLNALDLEKGIIRHFGSPQGFRPMRTRAIAIDSGNRIWMATDEGMALVDPEKNRVKYLNQRDGIAEDLYFTLLIDKFGRIWNGSLSQGLNIIDQNGELVFPFGKTSFTATCETRDGTLWMGTSTNGIILWDMQHNKLSHLNKSHGLSDNFVQSIVEEDGCIWVTSYGGFDIIDPRRKIIEHYGRKQGLISDSLYAVARDDHGNLWFTGPTLGIEWLDSAKNMLRWAGVKEGLSEELYSDLKPDHQGRIWAATRFKGVDLIDVEGGTIQNLHTAPGLRDTCYRVLLPDRWSRMWIGTDQGLYLADKRLGTLTSITTQEGLSSNFITSIMPYQDKIVASTRVQASVITSPAPHYAGVNSDTSKAVAWKVALVGGTEGLIKESGGWNTDLVTHDGRLVWADNGVSIINHIQEQQGSASVNVTGIFVMNQPLTFANEPRDNPGSRPSDQVQARRLTLRWDSVTGPYNLPVNLRIPYDQNYLQFQFGEAHLGRQDTTWYCYFLQGIDKRWSPLTSRPVSENYLNLPPGHYNFTVRSKNINRQWSQPARFSFVITPPWWHTWWAYTLYCLLAATALWGFISLRNKRLLTENKKLEHKIKIRTAEVQAQKEALIAQRDDLEKAIEDLQSTQKQLIQAEKMASLGELTAGIAHEIQNPLNFVNNFAEVSAELAEELKEGISREQIPAPSKLVLTNIIENLIQNQEKINFHGKRADSIVKGMLQHSRNSSGLKEPTDINALADEYLRLSFHGLRAKDKSFNAKIETEFDPHLPMITVAAQDIGRVLLNLFTNAFYSAMTKKKHMPEGFQPKVEVRTSKKGNSIEIRVRDNGMGIAQNVMDKIYNPFFTTKPTGEGTGLGLSLSYEIITKGHGGTIEAQTKEGEYAEFIIRLPLEQPIGTQPLKPQS
jgi:signal transduction histidine kinase/ligand-binding sensor domain-containing protein